MRSNNFLQPEEIRSLFKPFLEAPKQWSDYFVKLSSIQWYSIIKSWLWFSFWLKNITKKSSSTVSNLRLVEGFHPRFTLSHSSFFNKPASWDLSPIDANVCKIHRKTPCSPLGTLPYWLILLNETKPPIKWMATLLSSSCLTSLFFKTKGGGSQVALHGMLGHSGISLPAL